MKEDLPDFSRLPEDSAKNLHHFGVGSLVLLVLLLLLAIVYSIGEKLNGFRWHTFRNGLMTFGLIMLTVCVAVVTVSFALRGLAYLLPETVQHFRERRQLKKARNEAHEAISEKHRLNEERARLTAQLQATFLFEKETLRSANARASQEFRQALQSSVLRSCEIAFEQINRLVAQYEQVVSEIESSSLPAADKTDLLSSLTEHLDIAATEKRNEDAQKLMESEIWKVRFQKARLLADRQAGSAVRYLKQIRSEARSAKMKSRITAMIHSLENA